MLNYKLVNVAERKAQIIETIGEAAYADIVVSMRDRIIIADLVISGMEKVLKTIDAHLAMSTEVLSSEDSAKTMLMMAIMEMGLISEDLLQQIQLHLLKGLLAEDMAEEQAPGRSH